MKRILAIFVLGIMLTFGVSTHVSANASGTINVSGRVYNGDHLVTGANVIVTCVSADGSPGQSATMLTNGTGFYDLTISSALCPSGSTLRLQAAEGNYYATTSVPVPETGSVNVNLSLQNILPVGSVPLPEMNRAMSFVGLTTAAGIFLVIRRRQTIHASH